MSVPDLIKVAYTAILMAIFQTQQVTLCANIHIQVPHYPATTLGQNYHVYTLQSGLGSPTKCLVECTELVIKLSMLYCPPVELFIDFTECYFKTKWKTIKKNI